MGGGVGFAWSHSFALRPLHNFGKKTDNPTANKQKKNLEICCKTNNEPEKQQTMNPTQFYLH